MNEDSKKVITDSVKNRLKLSGLDNEEQAQVWCEAVVAILEDNTEEKISQYPKNGQSNFRKMIALCQNYFSLEIAAYKKFKTDCRKGISPDEAAARMRTRLEHQQQPLDFS